MLLELAQSVQGPVNLVTGEPPAPGQPILPLWLGLTIIGAVIATGLLVWAVLARRAAIDRDPAEYAFRALVRRLGVPQRHAVLIRKLAAGVQCAPVALLLSDYARKAAVMSYEKTNPSKRQRVVLEQLSS